MNKEANMAKVTVEVDVDLGELDEDALVGELESRGYGVHEFDPPTLDMDLMRQIHQHLAMNQEQQALGVLRPYLLDILGKAL